jgi:hypothetical protein
MSNDSFQDDESTAGSRGSFVEYNIADAIIDNFHKYGAIEANEQKFLIGKSKIN